MAAGGPEWAAPGWGPQLAQSAPPDEGTLFADGGASWGAQACRKSPRPAGAEGAPSPPPRRVEGAPCDGTGESGSELCREPAPGGSGSGGEEALELLWACRRVHAEHQRAAGEQVDRWEALLAGREAPAPAGRSPAARGPPPPAAAAAAEAPASPGVDFECGEDAVEYIRMRTGSVVSVEDPCKGLQPMCKVASSATFGGWKSISGSARLRTPPPPRLSFTSAHGAKLRFARARSDIQAIKLWDEHKLMKMKRLGQDTEALIDYGVEKSLSLGSYKSHRSSRSPVASAETWKQRWQRRCYGVLAHPLFDGVMGALITLNTLVIGVELMVFPPMTTPAPEGDAVFESLEHAFLLIYVAELSARIFACGMKCMRTNWVRFDFVLVSFGVVDSWLVPLVLLCAGEAVQKSWSPPTFMRILKLGRLARSLRLFVQFRTLWMLVSGLSQSLTTIVNVFIVLSLTLFIFACLGIEMITSNPKSFDEGTFGDIVNDYWSTLPKVMLTLVQFVTLDSIGQIYKPLIEEDWMLVLFFIPFILVVSVVVMNLVTAVVIEVFLDHAKRDQEMRQIYKNHYTRAILPQLRAMFEDLDVDGNGYITLVELQHASEELQMDLGKLLNVDSLFDLFDALDADGSGEISIDEFLEGITQLSATNSRGLELTRILNMLKLILRHVAPQDPVTRSALPSARRAAPSSGAQSPKSPKSPKRRGGGGWAAAAARRAPDRSARSPA